MNDSIEATRRLAALWLLLPAATLAAGPTGAGGDEEIEEIVVTADFRERVLAELPASVSVLSENTLRQAAVQHFEELTFLVPNLNYAGGSNRPRYFQIRGIGERSQYEGAPNPSVGFLIDDIDFSGIGGIALTWDVAQIEVLRGPQGTRYGANALAGLINLQSVEPTRERAGRLRVLAGGDSARGASLAIGGPLTELASFRFSANHYQSDGFRDNVFLGADDTNGRDESDAKARFRWEAEDWQVDLNLLYVDVDNGYDAFAIDNGLTTYSDKPGRDAQRSLGGALKLLKEFGTEATLISITSAARSDIDFSFDADWGNSGFWTPYTYDFFSRFLRERDTISQELRLVSGPDGRLAGGRMAWLAGVYAMRLDEDNREDSTGLYADPAFGAFPLEKDLHSDYEALSTAAFGQLDWTLTDGHELSAGLRVEHRASDYTDSLDGAFRNDLGDSETMLGGQLSYRYSPGERHRAYLSLSRGYKAGGFNLGSVPSEEERYFEAEALWNLETGIRSTWVPAVLESGLTFFVSRREDQQIGTSRQLVAGDPSSFIFFTDNAATGRSIGVEGDVRWSPRESLEFYGSIGLMRVEFDDYSTPDGVDLSGREQAHAPSYSFALGAAWTDPRGWFARIDISGKDDFYFSDSHDQRSEPYHLVNLRFGYARAGWTASLWGRNVLDERYAVRGFYFGNEPPDFPDERYIRLGDPRQIGLTLEYGF